MVKKKLKNCEFSLSFSLRKIDSSKIDSGFQQLFNDTTLVAVFLLFWGGGWQINVEGKNNKKKQRLRYKL